MQLRSLRVRGGHRGRESTFRLSKRRCEDLTPAQTPMGALSVVISAILSHVILKEKLSLFGWIGSIQCILGASILALNAPEEQSVTNIADFKKLFLAPGFLSWGSVVIVCSVILAAWVAPRYGHKSMLPYIGVCSLVGGLSVSCIQGLGACILTSIRGDNQVCRTRPNCPRCRH
jgi:drug/metabolite transporter (DMT)-like permease